MLKQQDKKAYQSAAEFNDMLINRHVPLTDILQYSKCPKTVFRRLDKLRGKIVIESYKGDRPPRRELNQRKTNKWFEFLNRQIDLELEKPENVQSIEFIDECNSLLYEVCGETCVPDPKEKERRLAGLHMAFEKRSANKRRHSLNHIWKLHHEE